MRMWIPPVSMFRRSPSRPTAEAPRAAQAAVAVEPEQDAAEASACDRLLREIAMSASLVSHGVAVRVVVCNAPGTIDFDEIRLIADACDVTIEPVVRVGGGGFDFAIARREPAHG